MAVGKKLNYEERLLYVTRNLVVYNEYGNDQVKASKIVRKYFPAKSLEACTKSMASFVKAYEDGISFVERNKGDYWKSERPPALMAAEKVFFEDHSDISSGILYGMLYDVFNWYHER